MDLNKLGSNSDLAVENIKFGERTMHARIKAILYWWSVIKYKCYITCNKYQHLEVTKCPVLIKAFT